MTSAKNVANAVGGKTARACDSCITKRARWFCVADDAFLCQACDSSVHSANPLALRHERVHLKITSSSKSCAPSWHRGFTKKARTPRHGNNKHSTTIPFHLVPEVGYLDDTNSNEEREEQLLYRVPIFHPIVGELCTTPTSVATSPDEAVAVAVAEALVVETKGTKGSYNNYGVESIHGFLLSDIELDGFDADIESLLGKGLENQCMGMEELGLIDSKEENCNSRERKYCVGSGMVKEEKEEVAAASAVRACKVKVDQFEMGREIFESCFEYGGDHDESPVICKEVEEKVALDLTIDVKNDGEVKRNNQAKMNTLLQLDYEAVITAWASQKSPWVTAGDKLDSEPDQCWPHCMGTCGMELHHQHYVEFGGLFGGHPAMADGGREARVSRYREKRRTRLFSKKIRYEVRKLNAEKRPRMKGRFVKRASFAAPPTFPLLNK